MGLYVGFDRVTCREADGPKHDEFWSGGFGGGGGRESHVAVSFCFNEGVAVFYCRVLSGFARASWVLWGCRGHGMELGLKG